MSSATSSAVHSEKPLSPLARIGLVVSASATIILFYLFFSVTALLLLAWVVVELIVALVGARFGLLGLMSGMIHRHAQMFVQTMKCLWNPAGTEFQIDLEPRDAPGLFEIVSRLSQRLDIRPPQKIALEMSAGAWVQMRGLHRNLGQTRVGVGLDLLAALSPDEVSAVLGHELTHAKLINRFFYNWLNGGLRRAARLAGEFAAVVESGRQADKNYVIARAFGAVADKLTQWCAKMVSLYSRQHEFAADLGAARLCGAGTIRQALLKLEALAPKVERFGWSERLAAVNSPSGLTTTLSEEFHITAAELADVEIEAGPADRYSTHPSLADRLANLPESANQPLIETKESSLSLLSTPDEIARGLTAEINRKLRQLEAKDERELKKNLNKLRRTKAGSSAMLGVVVALLVAPLAGWVLWTTGEPVIGILSTLAGFAAAFAFWKWGIYRDRVALPDPPFTVVHESAYPDASYFTDIEARDTATRKELEDEGDRHLKKSAKISFYNRTAYAALESCDYLRAHVASRLSLQLKSRNPEAALAHAIAAAAHHQGETMVANAEYLLRKTGLRTPSTLWGMAWAFALSGDHFHAEMLLHDLRRRFSLSADQTSFLAWCQAQRNKPQAALNTLAPLCTPQPPTATHAKMMLHFLLNLGRTSEALALLKHVPAGPTEDTELVLGRLRLQLLRRDKAAAKREVDYLRETPTHTGKDLYHAGGYLRAHREDALAGELFEEALNQGNYPEAHIALAVQALHRKDLAEARARALSALDSTVEPAPKAARIGDIFLDAMNVVMATYSRAPQKTWLGEVWGGEKDDPLKGRTLLIYALNREGAEAHLREVLEAIHPDRPVDQLPRFEIELAGPGLQRTELLYPGIQYVHA